MQHPSTCSCSRRSFLKGSGLTLTGFGIASLFPTPFIQHALTSGTNNDRLIAFDHRFGCVPDLVFAGEAEVPERLTLGLAGGLDVSIGLLQSFTFQSFASHH